MILIDTGYLLALADARDALHARANAWAEALAEPVLVTEFVLTEAVNSMSSVSFRSRVHLLLEYLLSKPDCNVVPAGSDLFRQGLEFHKSRKDKEWSPTDCISFLVMRERRITQALSYDHHFEQAGFQALLRRDP